MVLRGTKYTLSELMDDVSNSILDTGDIRWTEAQKELAIKRAVREASPNWWEERIDIKHHYEAGTTRYELPPASSRVQEVRFYPLPSEINRKIVSPTAWHVEGNELVFEEDFEDYAGSTIYIHYAYYQKNLLDTTGTDGVLDSGNNTLTSASATFVTDGVKEGDAVILVGRGRDVVASVDSETQLTLWTDLYGGTDVTYYIAYYTDMPYEYLINKALSELYMIALRNRPGVEVEQYIRLSDYHRQLASLGLARNKRLGQIEEFNISDIEARVSRLALSRAVSEEGSIEELE